MIITCPCKKKQFKIDLTLIPSEGRDLQCGTCNHVWFYKVEDQRSAPLTLNEDIINNEFNSDLVKQKIEIPVESTRLAISEKPFKKENSKTDTKRVNIIGKLFSYLIVFIISFVALVILIDTFKTPLINVFPNIEIILFNLFETLKDIKLFIIDLS